MKRYCSECDEGDVDLIFAGVAKEARRVRAKPLSLAERKQLFRQAERGNAMAAMLLGTLYLGQEFDIDGSSTPC